jgi:hypothetical protein
MGVDWGVRGQAEWLMKHACGRVRMRDTGWQASHGRTFVWACGCGWVGYLSKDGGLGPNGMEALAAPLQLLTALKTLYLRCMEPRTVRVSLPVSVSLSVSVSLPVSVFNCL